MSHAFDKSKSVDAVVLSQSAGHTQGQTADSVMSTTPNSDLENSPEALPVIHFDGDGFRSDGLYEERDGTFQLIDKRRAARSKVLANP